jgi:hypothetical protein
VLPWFVTLFQEVLSMAWLNRRRNAPQRFRPVVEHLEDRWVPASVFYDGSNLFVSNPTYISSLGHTNLQVLQQSSGAFEVLDNTSFNGIYRVTGSITITTGNFAQLVTVTLNNSAGNGRLGGGLSITTGNSNDTINVNGTVGNEFIGGNVLVDGGNGNDNINLGASVGFRIGGTTHLSGNLGTDAANIGNGATPVTFQGDLNFHAIQSIPLATLGSNYTLQRGLGIDKNLNQTSGATKVFSFNLTFPANMNLPGALRINGGGSGGPFGDTITLDSTDTVGSLSIILGLGNNSVTVGGTVNGNASISFAGGSTITVDAGTTINANKLLGAGLTLSMGSGPNTYNLDNAFTVFGNTSITAPATNSTNPQTVVLDATIQATGIATGDGNLTVSLGNAVNSFTLDTGASAVNFTYTPGTGGDTVNINNDSVAHNNIFITVPNANGVYNLNLNFAGPNSPLKQDVTFSGGNAAGASGAIMVNKNGDTNVVCTNNLPNTFTVTGC